MAITPMALVLIVGLIAAMVAPLIPMRRRPTGLSAFPFITLLLLASNLLIFFATTGRDGEPRMDILTTYGLLPSSPAVYTLITHMFLHGSLLHVCGNMLGLWLFGPHVEEAVGHWEYGLFYFGCGIAAALTHLLITHFFLTNAVTIPMVGASGAIFGILGLFAVRFWRAKVRVFLIFQIQAVWAVSAFVLLQIIAGLWSFSDQGLTESSANWAHIGGFFFGAIMAVPLRMREQSRREYDLEDAAKSVALGENDAAAVYYRNALLINANDPETHYALAKVYIKLRQGEAAHRHFMDALRLHLQGGHSLAAARVYEDAIAGFEAFPLPAFLLQRVASACEESFQYSLAVHALAELCRDHPGAKEAEMSLLRLGKLQLNKMNQPQNAEGIFAEFIRLYPESEWRMHAQKLRQEARVAGSGLIAVPSGGRSKPSASKTE
jgi:membrane associated rhomboid family serine protease